MRDGHPALPLAHRQLLEYAMKTLTLALTLAIIAFGTFAEAQTTAPATWPTCKLGAAPIDPSPAPSEAKVFPAAGGPVLMTEAGRLGSVRMIRCQLPVGTPSYRGADGVLRDVASNQPYFPVKWDAAPPQEKPGRDGVDGRDGINGKDGVAGRDGINGTDGRDGRDFVPPPKRFAGEGGSFPWKKALLWTGAIVGGTYATYWATHRPHHGPGARTGPAF